MDFPHPGYPRGAVCSHTARTAAAMPGKCLLFLPCRLMSNGKGLPPRPHRGCSAWDSLLPPGVKPMPAFDPRVAFHFLQERRQNLEKSLQQMPRVQLPATARKTTRAIFWRLMSSGHLRPGHPGRALQFPQDGDASVLCFRTTSSPVLGSKMQL